MHRDGLDCHSRFGLAQVHIQLRVLKSDIPLIQTNPSLDDLLCVFKQGVWLYDSASVAAITPYFEDVSSIREGF
jgi:hypothetical protein